MYCIWNLNHRTIKARIIQHNDNTKIQIGRQKKRLN